MRKWNVYSQGADKWGRRRPWRALTRTVTFTYRRAAANIKPCRLCTLQCNLPHLYINQTPAILIRNSPLISNLICLLKQHRFCVAFRWFPTHDINRIENMFALLEKNFTYSLILPGLNNMVHRFPSKLQDKTPNLKIFELFTQLSHTDGIAVVPQVHYAALVHGGRWDISSAARCLFESCGEKNTMLI